jgi:hypothetical protein
VSASSACGPVACRLSPRPRVQVGRARRAVTGACLVVAGCLTGCSSTPPAIGDVHGVLVVYRGLVIAGGGPAATSGTIEAVQGSTVVATEVAGTNGKFSFRLSPGSYRLKVTSFPPPMTCRPSHLSVAASTTVSVKVDCENMLVR